MRSAPELFRKTISLVLLGTMSGCGEGPLTPTRSPKAAAEAIQLEGLTVTVSPTTRTPETQCAAPYDCSTLAPPTENPAAGLGGGGTSSSGTSGLPGDADGDGDTLDDGPGAFAVCVAAKLGVGGWAAIGGSALTGYQLYQARQSHREAYQAYHYYNDTYKNTLEFNTAIHDLYLQAWKNAKQQEEQLWATFFLTSAGAVAALAVAVGACAPFGAAPTV